MDLTMALFLIAGVAGFLVITLAMAFEIRRLRERSDPFDHDGDGKPGGSKPKHPTST